jgi:CheY-like chemotaxis protein
MSTDERSFPEPDAAHGQDTVSALEALHGLPIAGGARFPEGRLTHVVTATLRAAIDLLSGDETLRRPVAVTGDDGVLEVTLTEVRADQLHAAGALLETVEGNVAPAEVGSGFRLRVPTAGTRNLYLMLEQGTLRFAVPWHAVLRIRIARPEAVEQMARREGCRLLPSFVSVPRAASECPVVLVGLGFRRAFLLADRLVWRMAADPVLPADAAPSADFGHAVRAADGVLSWVVDPVRLLRGVETPPLPPPGRGPVRVATVRPASARPSAAPTAPRSATPLPFTPPQATRVESRPAIRELRREDVEPLSDPLSRPEPTMVAVAPIAPPPSTPVSVAAGPAPRAAMGAEPQPEEPVAARRRALVAEDSFVGRIFLQRLLESLGFAVELTTSARELEPALARGPWDLLMIDVELPDSPRGEHLRVVRGRPDVQVLVALVRDRLDEQAAAEIGVQRALRKPYERAELLHLLRELGFAEIRP